MSGLSVDVCWLVVRWSICQLVNRNPSLTPHPSSYLGDAAYKSMEQSWSVHLAISTRSVLKKELRLLANVNPSASTLDLFIYELIVVITQL